jgi:NAD(P)-dependent dehydrogenase (short-subunit alcohol dehydrogenase family)
MNVQGKTIVLTGGGSGMGREMTLLLLKKGARVAIVDINESTLKETAELAGDHQGRLTTHVLNITDKEAVAALPEAVIKAHGAVDGLINNAGIIQPFVKINDLAMKDIERVFNVNFWGVVNMTKAFLPHLLKRPEAHIVNTSSMGGFLPVPGQSAYGASKAAVKLFTEGLRSELLSTNVHVTVVFPGAIATNISTNSGITAMPSASSADQSKFKTTSAPDAARIIISLARTRN